MPRVGPPAAGASAGAAAWDLLARTGMKRLLLVNWLLSMSWDVQAFAVPILGHERGFARRRSASSSARSRSSVAGVRLAHPDAGAPAARNAGAGRRDAGTGRGVRALPAGAVARG